MTITACDVCGISASDKFIFVSVKRYNHQETFSAFGQKGWKKVSKKIDLCSRCKRHLDKYLKFVDSKW